MSLKAKIEAVIYASEEPVTLAQLIGLLGEEGQAELDALRSQQTTLALTEHPEVEAEANDPDALNAEFLAPEADAGAIAGTEAVEAAGADPGDAVKESKARDRTLRDHFRLLVESLVADYAAEGRGLEIREVAGGYRLATKPEYHDAVRGFVKSLKPPLKLSLQALETLAVVAYKQPVTAPEIAEIRGVDAGGVLGGLMARKLVTTAGRKQVIGRPILYKTTKDFLVRFGLKDVSELPSIEEFEKMAGELTDIDPVQEEIPMEEPREKGESGAVDEINSAPEATDQLHESTDAMIADKSVAPEGHEREHNDPHDVEPMADVHEAQADGTP